LGSASRGLPVAGHLRCSKSGGLLSQVRWAGGAAARDINPAPLFDLNFNSAGLGQVARSSLLKQMLQGFAKGKAHGYFN